MLPAASGGLCKELDPSRVEDRREVENKQGAFSGAKLSPSFILLWSRASHGEFRPSFLYEVGAIPGFRLFFWGQEREGETVQGHIML